MQHTSILGKTYNYIPINFTSLIKRMFMNSRRKILSLLAWFTNQTLGSREHDQVTNALRKDPGMAMNLQIYQSINEQINLQPELEPTAQTYKRLHERIENYEQKRGQTQNQPRNWKLQSTAFLSLALSVFILLWLVVQPGMVLEWSTHNGGINAFRIYRAPNGSNEFTLVGELTAEQDTVQYSYVDSLLLPGQEFTYVVEGVQNDGRLATSEPLQGNTLTALPGQLSLLLTSLILAWLILFVIRNLPYKVRLSPLLLA